MAFMALSIITFSRNLTRTRSLDEGHDLCCVGGVSILDRSECPGVGRGEGSGRGCQDEDQQKGEQSFVREH